jgi:hypothetical protein
MPDTKHSDSDSSAGTAVAPPRSMTTQLADQVRSAAVTIATIIAMLRAYLASRLRPVLGDDRGEIASWVVVTALVVAAAIVIVGIVTVKLTRTANNIQTP